MNKLTVRSYKSDFILDEAGTESAEYTVLALIVFVLLLLFLVPIGGRLEFLWRGLLDILHELRDVSPASPESGLT